MRRLEKIELFQTAKCGSSRRHTASILKRRAHLADRSLRPEMMSSFPIRSVSLTESDPQLLQSGECEIPDAILR